MVYSQIGSGQPIVLLHGFLEERGMWSHYAEKLSTKFKVICIDLLGQGESGSTGYVHSMEEQAAAVVAVLFIENVEKCKVVGHSMGGYIALALAEKHPELIDGLVLFHSTVFPDLEDKKSDRERVIRLVQRNKSIYVNAAIPTLFAEHSCSALTSEIQQVIDVASGFLEQGIIANIRGMMERKDRSGILKNGKFRKLIIHGELDSVISLDDAKRMAVLNDEIQLEILEDVSHMGHLEAPEKCLQLITDYCKN